MATTLQCTQCGYENEGERVYCHNCGVKLDRTVVPTEEKKVEAPAKASKRVRRMTNPPKFKLRLMLKTLIATLLWAVTVAALVQIARPPVGAPAADSERDLVDAPFIGIELEQGLRATQPFRYNYTATQINGYLRNLLKPKKVEGGGTQFASFGRAYVNLREGVCIVGIDHRLFGYPIHARTAYEVSIDDAGINARNVGGWIGHLPVHPVLMAYSDFVFGRLWEALKRDRTILAQMRSITVHQDQVEIISKPAAR